jgi:hypothetical protein
MDVQTVSNTIHSLENLLMKKGLKVPVCEDVTKVHEFMEQIPAEQMSEIDKALNEYHEIVSLEPPVTEPSVPEINTFQLGEFLHRHGLKFSKKLTDFVDVDHIIEVYSRDHRQVFRSTNFFELSSYSIHELTFTPWDKLFYRSEEAFDHVMKYIGVANDTKMDVMSPTGTRHILSEVDDRKKFTYEMIKIGSVTDNETDMVMGYMTIINVKEIVSGLQLLH